MPFAGQVVEQIGNLTGSNDWKASGREEAAKGDAEYKAAEAKVSVVDSEREVVESKGSKTLKNHTGSSVLTPAG